MTLREAAIWYAEHGFAVLPLRPGTKEPYANEGVTIATTDALTVAESWEHRPSANIGIATGSKSGIVVLDSDPRSGAPNSRTDLMELYGSWQETPECETGRKDGGRHLYFQFPAGLEGLPKEVADGMELRGDGNYVMAPPSIHPITGKPYIWDGEKEYESLLTIAPVPSWLMGMINDAKGGKRGLALAHFEAVIREAKPEPWLIDISDDSQLYKALSTDPKFKGLWEKGWTNGSSGYPSHSHADEALLVKLVFWYGHDPARIDRMFRRSALMRKKYDKRADYRIRSIGFALEQQTKVWELPRPMTISSDGAATAATSVLHSPDEDDVPWEMEGVPSVWDLEAKVEWLIPGILPKYSITMLSGISGHGKTLFATKMAGCVAHGLPFLDQPVEQGMVIYLDRENPLAAVKKHLFDLRIEPIPSRFHYLGLWIDPEPDAPNSQRLVKLAKKFQPLIVFDSASRFHGGDENSAQDTAKFIARLRPLTKLGATVLLLHNASDKGGAPYRGSSDFRAGIDVGWLFQRTDGDTAGLIKDVTLIAFKNRYVAGEVLQLTLEDGDFRRRPSDRESNLETFQRLLRENPGILKGDLMTLAKQNGIPERRADDLFDQGEKDGWLRIESAGKNGKKCYWAVPGEAVSDDGLS